MTQKRTNENDLVVSGTAAAARRKAPRPRVKHSAAPAEVPAIPASPASSVVEMAASSASPEELLTPVAAIAPEHAAIARLAYSYWLARGCQGGSAEEDWLRAEGELRGSTLVS